MPMRNATKHNIKSNKTWTEEIVWSDEKTNDVWTRIGKFRLESTIDE